MSAPASDIIYTQPEKLKTFAFSSFANLIDGSDLYLIAYLIAPLTQTFHASLASVAILASLTFVGSVVGGLLFGDLSDRYGRRPAVVGAMISFGALTILCGLATSLSELYVLRFLSGLGIGGTWGIASSLVNEALGKDNRGKLGSIQQGMNPIGSIIAVNVTAFSLLKWGASEGWRYSFYIIGVLAVAAGLLMLLSPESRLWRQYRDYRKEGKLPAGYRDRQPVAQIFTRSVLKTTIFASIVASGIIFFTQASGIYTATLLGEVYKFPVATYTEMITVTLIVSIVSVWMNGIVSDSIGRKGGQTMFAVVSIAGAILFLYFVTQHLAISNPFLFPVFLAILIFSCGSGGLNGVWGVWMSELYPTSMRSTGNNFTYMTGRAVGGGLAGIIIPILAGPYGLGEAMAIGVLAGTIVVFLGLFGLKESKGTTMKAV